MLLLLLRHALTNTVTENSILRLPTHMRTKTLVSRLLSLRHSPGLPPLTNKASCPLFLFALLLFERLLLALAGLSWLQEVLLLFLTPLSYSSSVLAVLIPLLPAFS
jgi:hypothetical protein